MNANRDANLVVRLLTEPNKANLMTNFMLKLNAPERNNFTKASNKTTWLKNWLKRTHGFNNEELNSLVNNRLINSKTAFNRYLNSVLKFKDRNMKLLRYMDPNEPPPWANLRVPKKGYIQLEPVCANNFNRGVYIHYGETFKEARVQKVGYRLRKAAVNAAKNLKIPLYQVSQNIEGLVKPGNLPISGKIMKSLGATQLNWAPPCRASNKRGPQNYVFVVGGSGPFIRPKMRRTAEPKMKRTLTKRTR